MNCKFSNKIRINRQCEDVWTFLTDVSSLSTWGPGIERSEQTDDGETGRGSTLLVVANGNPLQVTVNYWEPPKRLTIGFNSPRYGVEVHLELVSLYNFTEVDLKSNLSVQGFWVLLSPLIFLYNSMRVNRWLESARRHLEDG